MGYFKKAIISVSWVSAFRVVNRLIAFAKTALLARLLTPAQFGDYGIAALVLALVEIFTETGINVFLVQQEDDAAIHTYQNTAWVTSIFRGILIAAIVAVSSYPVSRFFNNPASFSLILMMSLVPLIRGFINPAVAKFQKQLEFNKEFWLRFIIAVVDALVAGTTALLWKHPASLVYGLIAGAFTEAGLTLLFISPKPRFVFNSNQTKQVLHQGKWVTSAGIAAYFANKGIDMSIGKFLSAQSLGLYQMAYKMSVLFVDELVEMFNRVAFPVYTRIAGDKTRLRLAFLKTYVSFVGLIVVLMVGVSQVSPLLVFYLLGSQWIEIIPYVKLLCYVGVAIALAAPTNPLFLAVKKQNYLNHVVMVQCLAFFLLLIPQLRFLSLTSVILTLCFSILASVPLRTYFAVKIIT